MWRHEMKTLYKKLAHYSFISIMKFLRHERTIESLYFDIQWNIQLNITKWMKLILT